ncbi:MAG: NYN domain-containing protein [Paracoccaceae bacterium]|nr:NYN domain-containing protein [Paracoccaceae bacterium]MDE2676230.1 NYN domain-containing protein [Paracoccaceae bacterium]
MRQQLIRIGIFYDGGYFAKVSDYYRFHNWRKARISIEGFHDFLREEIAGLIGVKRKSCRVVGAHYYRGRYPAGDTDKNPGRLLGERKFDDALMKARVTTHYRPMGMIPDGRDRERGIDVLLTLDAYDAAVYNKMDVIVLVTGDGDFVPLVERLNSSNCIVAVPAWDIKSPEGDVSLRTSPDLLDVVPYPITMQKIEDSSKKNDPLVTGIFVNEGFKSVNRDVNEPDQNSNTLLPSGEESVTGVIVNLPAGRDFGFIAPDHGGENLFFHESWMKEGSREFEELETGDRAWFVIGKNDNTEQPTALDVYVEPTTNGNNKKKYPSKTLSLKSIPRL